ncbi:DUF4286 family protein [Riemerella columbipharyngis]|uniref:DUF4286 domain-containing protein n=1 Tax=Riemerella columbipharyngis TaxID=1071918 RepID=A0A1G7A3X4_9FLAO|nr:DUF4286 family protein [Riemerella columbipharyngis]SDE09618.1 protein of unknown function [Riemerella columbipharyngis]
MSLLSVTFHCENNALPKWEAYMSGEMISRVEKWGHSYIISEVETEMLQEGKNFNILLDFKSPIERESFLNDYFADFAESIKETFSDKVMIFVTILNSKRRGN